MEPIACLWGKSDRKSGLRHLLIYHMIDVGMTAKIFWQDAMPEPIRRLLCNKLDLDPNCGQRLFSFWASLHDIGKATPFFQSRVKEAVPPLMDCGLAFPPNSLNTRITRHGLYTEWILRKIWDQSEGMEVRLARTIARALGGHHGFYESVEELNRLFKGCDELGGERGYANWEQTWQEIYQSLAQIFQPIAIKPQWLCTRDRNILLALDAGFSAVTDWIGSQEEYFQFHQEWMPLNDYAAISESQAKKALQTNGWINIDAPKAKAANFFQIFGWHPRNLQAAAIRQIQAAAEQPVLVILEAPTGIGKTEIALYAANHWLDNLDQTGFYVAMPTRATSNQMYERTLKFVEKIFQDSKVNIRLVHGRSDITLKANTNQKIASTMYDQGEEEEADHYAWFLPKKRSLLAPFGVGTVDQTLLSVLPSKHHFVRLFGLANKTIVFDEVHAYDMYMNRLFMRMLEWLKLLQTPVIILSATLTGKARSQIIKCFAPDYSPEQANIQAGYPSITIATERGSVVTSPLPSPERKPLAIHWLDTWQEPIDCFLARHLSEGGCCAVICNTVGQAQTIYNKLTNSPHLQGIPVSLFHARFPVYRREQIEQDVLNRYHRNEIEVRPASILVATQVIEQSLDLDFDLMITALAPIDLIIQRAGRIHRHEGRRRPAKLNSPAIHVLEPGEKEGVPDFGPSAYVYDAFILWKSYLFLKNQEILKPSSDPPAWIEAIYNDEIPPQTEQDPNIAEEMGKALKKMKEKLAGEEREASSRLIAPPTSDYYGKSTIQLEEDNPEMHSSLQALTRLAEPSINLVCLHLREDGELETGDGQLVDILDTGKAETVRRLLLQEVSIHAPDVVRYFAGNQTEDVYPERWRRNSALRHHRLAVFSSGICCPSEAAFSLKLSETSGLEVIRNPKGG